MKYIFILLMIAGLFGCEKENNLEITKESERVTSFTLKEVNKSSLQWELKGKRAVYLRDTIVIYELQLFFYNREGSFTSELKADSGYVFENTKDLRAMGNVIVQSKDSTILWTRELNWIQKEQKIQTESPVKYKKGDKIYTGKGLESDSDLKHIIIKEKFQGKGEFE